jgi:hypothetical protein
MVGRSEYEMFRSSGHQAQTIIQCDGDAASFGQSPDLLLETTFAFQMFSEVERLTLFWKGRSLFRVMSFTAAHFVQRSHFIAGYLLNARESHCITILRALR